MRNHLFALAIVILKQSHSAVRFCTPEGPVPQVIHPRPFVDNPVRPGLLAPPVHLVLCPLPLKHAPIRPAKFASPVSLTKLPVSVVNVSSGVHCLSLSRLLVKLPLSFIDVSTGKRHLASPVLPAVVGIALALVEIGEAGTPNNLPNIPEQVSF
jgi:hypothetical protein